MTIILCLHDEEQEGPRMGGGQIFDTGPFFARLQYMLKVVSSEHLWFEGLRYYTWKYMEQPALSLHVRFTCQKYE